MKSRIFTGLAGAAGAGALVAIALAWQSALPTIDPKSVPAFDQAGVAHGANLARIGDCAVCHTSPSGSFNAGGRPVRTPFGEVYASNITPDPATGIGTWSRAAFVRAMRRGVRRDGAYLYPAFPYNHYTHLSDHDLDGLYAFLMTRTAVSAVTPDNRLVFPLGFRPLLAGWDLLFLRTGAVPNAPDHSAEWNRGHYLAESLAHCGACHTPRNVFGAEKSEEAYSGGWADGWFAPPLNTRSPALRPWTSDRLYLYLRTGLDPDHAAAAGPMGPVSYQLARAPEADVRAIADYIASLMPPPSSPDPIPAPDHADEAAKAVPDGAVLFAGACATCHGTGAPMMLAGRPPLGFGTPLHESTPRDTIQIVLQGLKPPAGPSGPYMPAFGDSLTDRQIADIVGYLRERFDDHGHWPDLLHAVQAARKESSG
ncbi:MAG: c-type cytochrome [Janthinobacterium lividum]